MPYLVMINLDDETRKIWNKIPKGDRSAMVREYISSLAKEDTEDFQTASPTYGEDSEESPGQERLRRIKGKLRKKPKTEYTHRE